MRLDRLITLSMAQPARRLLDSLSALGRGPGRGAASLPILMYHSISGDPESERAAYFRTNTSPAAFARHMDLLRDLGYRGVTLSEGLAWLKSVAPPSPPRTGKGQGEVSSCASSSSTLTSQPVVITFDDGYHDFYTEAFPVLKKHGFSATMYLPTAFIGETRRRFAPRSVASALRAEGFPRPSDGRGTKGEGNSISPKQDVASALCADSFPRPSDGRGTKGEGNSISSPSPRSVASALCAESLGRGEVRVRECLTWDEVRELDSYGIEFGSHTVNHPKLVELDWAQIATELQQSKDEIEQRLQKPVPAFAYPYAFPQAVKNFADGFCHLLAEAGYESCVTTEIGRAKPGDNPFLLRRLPANSDDDNNLLSAKLEGHYDWLARPQALIKQVKCIARGKDRVEKLPMPETTHSTVSSIQL